MKARFAITIFLLAGTALLWQCRDAKKEPAGETESGTTVEIVRLSEDVFGEMPDGREVARYTLRNAGGMEMDVIAYGGIITRWTAPDREGNREDIVLGYDSLPPYLESNPYFGALVGRYGNRIAGGQFSLDGETYTLAKNNGPNHLHGGIVGFGKVLWEVSASQTDSTASVVLTYRSADGEEGYPGNLDAEVTYTLTDADELDIRYRAQTDKPTVVNLTQHSYFNLSGDFSQTILDHELMLNADAYLPVDGGLIPTGELRPVAGTPFDFTRPKPIGREIGAENEQLALGGGYDHCWALNNPEDGFRLTATAYHPDSGRKLEVYTTEPGVQFYTGNFLDGSLQGKGATYGKRSGFCLETQHYPDSPNQPAFPSTRLDPGQTYASRTLFKLTTD